ncbi:MAG TPA: hypothetical protein VNX29_16040 [Kaistia sp.]|nr:hypothetical protein [Kaistia sp.]
MITAKSIADIVALAFSIGASALWVVSWRVKVPSIGPGLEELDKVTDYAKALSVQSKWNSFAALCTALALGAQIVAKALEMLASHL